MSYKSSKLSQQLWRVPAQLWKLISPQITLFYFENPTFTGLVLSTLSTNLVLTLYYAVTRHATIVWLQNNARMSQTRVPTQLFPQITLFYFEHPTFTGLVLSTLSTN